MTVILILSILLNIILLLLWILSRRNLRHSEKELRQIRNGNTGRRLRLASPDHCLEGLVAEVNLLLDDCQKSEQDHRRAEQERRDEIANISHDLRTPLTSILGYLQLMEQPSCTPEERREYLTVCENRAHTLQDLLAGFYDLSRLEAGGYPLELEILEPSGMLYQLIADYYMEFVEAKMEPVMQITQPLPTIYADRQGIRRIFQNLIQNAVRHGGNTLTIDSYTSKDFLYLRFCNPAPELSQEDCERLFDRFFTADRMRTGKGTGLGLAIVKALCIKMGGNVSATLSNGQLIIQTGFRLSCSNQ
ncbi:MAG: sensor histidine kinase [Candidatus Merdivicinus sp.]|jgi:signal transduction histidine kinase